MQIRSKTSPAHATFSKVSVFALFAGLALTSVATKHVHAQCELAETLKLMAVDGGWDNEFGFSIAISGNTVVVGSRNETAYLFNTTTGQQIAKLMSNDGAAFDYFGCSVAISGTTALIGARRDDDNGDSSGSAYLFNTATGDKIIKLLPNDGAEFDYFGISVAISGNTAVIGAYKDDDNDTDSGSAYLFDTRSGKQIAKLLPNDGARDDRFGYSVAISGTTVVVGARWNDANGINSGSAYLFDTITGQQIAELLPNDGAAEDEFGRSVAISGTMAVVGAPKDGDNGSDSGSAYLFETTTGMQIAKLVPDDGIAKGLFGWSVAISPTTAVVGAYENDDNEQHTGSAYIFDTTTGIQIAKLMASDGAFRDEFGWSVAISAATAVVGARKDGDYGSESGSAYVFELIDCPDCLDLVVDDLIAGDHADFKITSGTPGAKAITVYGTHGGDVSVREYADYCATFAIKGVTQSKVIGGYYRSFDANGEIDFEVYIPDSLSGHQLYFQSAEHGTCPDECVSNLVEMVVQ